MRHPLLLREYEVVRFSFHLHDNLIYSELFMLYLAHRIQQLIPKLRILNFSRIFILLELEYLRLFCLFFVVVFVKSNLIGDLFVIVHNSKFRKWLLDPVSNHYVPVGQT